MTQTTATQQPTKQAAEKNMLRPFHVNVQLMIIVAVMLAVLAAIPLINFLALGYLLEAEGRVARTGKLRYALPLLPLAPRLGSIALGIWLWLWPVRWITDDEPAPKPTAMGRVPMSAASVVIMMGRKRTMQPS